MADDFVDIFSTGKKDVDMRHDWPDINNPQTMAKLANLFEVIPHHQDNSNLSLKPIPGMIQGETLTLSGTAIPDKKVTASTGYISVSATADSGGNFNIEVPLSGLKRNAGTGENLPGITVTSGRDKVFWFIDPRE